ncbi:MAG: DUF3945 domain-containing protein [Rikenellaceae bacterium]
MKDSNFARQLQSKIDRSFIGATTLGQLRINLYDNSVGVVYRESAEGRLYGVTYIDHTTGAILNGSQIGKNYSANMVAERLRNPNSVAHQYRFRIPNKLGGVALTEQQRVTPDLGKSIYMENMTNKSGDMMNAYVKCNEETGVLQFFYRDPDDNNLSQPQSQQPWQEREQPHDPEPTESNTYSHAQDQGESSSMASGGLGLFDMLPNRGDDPEEDDFRRRMQQKKKKRGRRM